MYEASWIMTVAWMALEISVKKWPPANHWNTTFYFLWLPLNGFSFVLSGEGVEWIGKEILFWIVLFFFFLILLLFTAVLFITYVEKKKRYVEVISEFLLS